MAEVVQQNLEGRLDELRDLIRRGIFTDREVRAIVKKRRAFEYLMQRRQVRTICNTSPPKPSIPSPPFPPVPLNTIPKSSSPFPHGRAGVDLLQHPGCVYDRGLLSWGGV